MLCDPDEMIDCPYCDPPKNHQLRYKRLNVHLVDLRKSDPTIGRDKVPCPFNAKHYVEKALKQDHMLHCPDRDVMVRSVLHEQEIASKQYEYRYEPVLNHDHITRDEYWEADVRNEFACNLRFKEERPSFSSQPSEDCLRQPKTAPRVLASNSTSIINSSENGSSVNQDPPRPRLAGYGRGVPKSSANAESRQATVIAPGVIASNNVPKNAQTATATRGFKLNPGPAKAQTREGTPTPQGSVKSGGSAWTMGAAAQSNGPAAPLGNVPSMDSNQIPANLRSSPSIGDHYYFPKKEYNSLSSLTKSVPSENIASQNPADIRLSAPNTSEMNSGSTYPMAPRQPAPPGGTFNPIRHTTITRYPLVGNSNEPATGSTGIRLETPAMAAAGPYRESSLTASRASAASNLMRPSDFTLHEPPSVPQTSSLGDRFQLGSAHIRGASGFSSNQPRISTPGLRMVTQALGVQPLKTAQSQNNDLNSGSQNEGSNEEDSSACRARQKKKLEKKLNQIEKLEQLQRPLNNEEAQKVASKSDVLKELAQL